ncbi:hypothetical protein GDO81_007722 [Engystomops pustulosus]|uniref:Uncharacterized protein n=1 Tax=Engystomops pustulosus TaxID=76066 RepID=A0AAV7C992_ENGPU|nr:hypothetical protein GDO81_007722 [Engystomops pustulosus]
MLYATTWETFQLFCYLCYQLLRLEGQPAYCIKKLYFYQKMKILRTYFICFICLGVGRNGEVGRILIMAHRLDILKALKIRHVVL